MKIKPVLLIAGMALSGFLVSQTAVNTVVEKHVDEIGTVNTIKVSVVHFTNLSDKTSKSILRIEHVPKKAMVSDTKTEFNYTFDVDELVKSLKEMMTHFDGTSKSEFSMVTMGGIEAGFSFVPGKPKAAAKAPVQASKTEKFYVKTSEKMYEGRTVFQDEKGTYIWKSNAAATPAASGASAPVEGQWLAYFQVEKNVTYSKVALTTADFKALVDLIESAKGKM